VPLFLIYIIFFIVLNAQLLDRVHKKVISHIAAYDEYDEH